MKVYKQLWAAFIGMSITVIIGTIGFQFFEGLLFFDALWMTVITLLTVGYGDLYPVTNAGKIFALIIIPIGIGLVAYALGAIAASIIEGKFSNEVGRRRMEKVIKNLKDHIIICGLGRVGHQVAKQLKKANIPYVIIDFDEEQLSELESDVLYILGDATEDETLFKAGIERAKGLVATLPQDADNVFITLTAKGLNPQIQVVSRVEKSESEEKLRRAGADKVINPSNISGRRMALSILKPLSIDYVDTILQTHQDEFGVEEFVIGETSPFINKTLLQSQIRQNYGVTVAAIKRGEGIISNPSANETLQINDIIIVFGTPQELTKFEQAIR